MRYGAKSAATPADWGLTAVVGMHVHIKPVKCGKVKCRVCPHFFYAYARWRENGARREKYLGKCNDKGFPERNLKMV